MKGAWASSLPLTVILENLKLTGAGLAILIFQVLLNPTCSGLQQMAQHTSLNFSVQQWNARAGLGDWPSVMLGHPVLHLCLHRFSVA